MVRGIDANIASIAWEAGDNDNPRSTLNIPTIGHLIGIDLDLTVTTVDSVGVIKAGAKLMNAIKRMQIRDKNGGVIMNVTGRQLERIANQLSAVGQDVDSPNPPDNAVADYHRFIPITIRAEDQPAFLDITEAAESDMYSTDPTTNPAVNLSLRGVYRQSGNVNTVRVKAFTPPTIVGENPLGAYLPVGELVDKLLVLPNDAGGNPLADSDVDFVRLTQGNFNYLQEATIDGKFQPEDTEFRRSGHNDGEINIRTPVFLVDNTTNLVLDLNTAANYDVVTVSRVPTQARR